MNHRQTTRASGRRAIGALMLTAGLSACDDGVNDPLPVTELQVTAPSAFLDVGQTLQLGVEASTRSGKVVDPARVQWTSRAPAVAEVQNGLIVGRGAGEVVIVASAGDARDSVRLTVETPVAALRVFPDSLFLVQDRAGTLFVEMYDVEGRATTHSLAYSSSAAAVSVSSEGEVRAASLGATVVTVTAGLRSVQVPVRVVTGERYRVLALGSAAGGSRGYGVNNRGEAVGSAVVASQGWRPFLWRNGSAAELPLPQSLQSYRSAEATSINDSGMVAGTARCLCPTSVTQTDPSAPLLWRAGSPVAVPVDSGPISWASGLNDRGQMIGAWQSSWASHAGGAGFLFEDGRFTWLRPPNSHRSSVRGINRHGVVALQAYLPETRLYLWERGEYRLILQPETGSTASIYGLNDRGQVAIYHVRDNSQSTWVWQGGAIARFDGIGAPKAINSYGDVAGDRRGEDAFLIRGGRMLRLNDLLTTSEWVITEVGGINDLGQIVASGRHRTTGEIQALLLIPTS